MTPTEVAAKLRAFNDWRRGGDIEYPGPLAVDEAIDAAVEMIDRLEAAEKAVTEAYQRGYKTGQEEIGKERDALRVEVERLTECLHRANAQAEHFEREWYLRGEEVDALCAKIAAMERQEPVGVLHVGSYYGEELEDWEFEANQCACDKLNEAYVHNPTSLPLYALPGAKGE